MTGPKVSVAMPVYDGVSVPFFDEAAQSVLGQTFRDFEFLILLDGVKREDLKSAIEAVAAKDSRVRLLHHHENSGISRSLNTLLAAAKGELIARMDADDVSLPERFAKQVEYLDAHPEVQILGTWAHEIDPSGQRIFFKQLPVEHDAIVRFMVKRDPFIHPTVMIRKRLFDELGDYSLNPDDDYIEDTELWARALGRGYRGHNLEEPLYLFRVSPETYGHRRGFRRALQEARLRFRFGRQMKMPSYLLAYPLATMSARLSPPAVMRWLYRNMRG
jgi:glycosyltransferase involved in cell wall biosynthesis